MDNSGKDAINKLENVLHYLQAIANKQTLALYVDNAIQMLKEQENAYRYLLKQFVEVQDQLNTKPEIVRCKDCKYCNKYDYMCDHPNEWGNEDTRNQSNPEWFCADGERRSSENDERDH